MADPLQRSVDDFKEFLSSAYAEVLSAFGDADLTVTVEAGTEGHYLLVATSHAGERSVEITDAGRPLPAGPDDVTSWTVTAPGNGTVTLPAGTAPSRLVQATRAALNAS